VFRIAIYGYINIIKTMTNVSAADLRRAANVMEKIEDLQSELNKILGGGDGSGIKRRGPKPKGGDVDKYKEAHGVAKKKRKMSAAGRAKIAAAARARWAVVKKAGKNSL
jgi:hypothetical protein